MSALLERTNCTPSKPEQQFKELYRKSKDMSSYLSEEEHMFILTNKENL